MTKLNKTELITKRIGHKYTTCQDGCINRLKYCGCAIICDCCGEHLTDCKNEYCKNCRVKGRHRHSNGSVIGIY